MILLGLWTEMLKNTMFFITFRQKCLKTVWVVSGARLWCRCHGWWLVAGVMAGAGAMAGGWGDGWCGALRMAESGEICMHCVAHFCMHAAAHSCFCMLMCQMMMPNKGCIDATML